MAWVAAPLLAATVVFWGVTPRPVLAETRVARFVRVDAPISDRVEDRVRRAVDQLLSQTKRSTDAERWPVLVLEIRSGPSNFGDALDLARFLAGPNTSGITTVAYVPESLEGHGVLVALACDEIAMAADAKIGNAGKYEQAIGPALRSGYVEIAQRRATVSPDLVLAMLDPSVELLEVETDVSREFVLRQRLAEVRKERAVGEPRVLVPAGEAALFPGPQARDLGLVRYLAADRQAVAEALNIPADALRDDPSISGGWRAIRLEITGPIRPRMVERLEAMLERQVRQSRTNFVLVSIDSPGGSPEDSLRLANYLAALDPSEVRTVAFIESEARADAALIALACDQIVMAPAATLGGQGAAAIEADDIPFYADAASGLAERKLRPPALAAAMFDPGVTVYRYLRREDGRHDYFSEAEIEARDDAESWQRQQPVTAAGRPLSVGGERAVELRLADATVADFAECRELFGLESDPALIEPGWADYLIDRLRSPLAAGTLLAIALIGLYVELQHPGIGIGGFISGLSFLLFFWAQYLGGTAGWLEALLFLAGVTCILIEVFLVPGVGVFGIGGGVLIVTALVLASQTFVLPRNEYQVQQLRNSLIVVVGAGAACFLVAGLLRRFLPSTPVLQNIFLDPPSPEERRQIAQREAMARVEHLLGQRGRAATRLSPAGKVRIGEELYDVITDGDLIDQGSEVVVIEARGNRVVVTAVGDTLPSA